MKPLRLADLPSAARKKLRRTPRGLGVNALPDYWVERHAQGLVLMERRGDRGADRCLALIPTVVLEVLSAAPVVNGLGPE